jgi:hypothetical protein
VWCELSTCGVRCVRHETQWKPDMDVPSSLIQANVPSTIRTHHTTSLLKISKGVAVFSSSMRRVDTQLTRIIAVQMSNITDITD